MSIALVGQRTLPPRPHSARIQALIFPVCTALATRREAAWGSQQRRGGEAGPCVNPQHGNEGFRTNSNLAAPALTLNRSRLKLFRLQDRVNGSTAVVAMAVLASMTSSLALPQAVSLAEVDTGSFNACHPQQKCIAAISKQQSASSKQQAIKQHARKQAIKQQASNQSNQESDPTPAAIFPTLSLLNHGLICAPWPPKIAGAAASFLFELRNRISYHPTSDTTRHGLSACLLDRANGDLGSRGLACGLADVGGATVQARSKITAYLCGEGAMIAGEETV